MNTLDGLSFKELVDHAKMPTLSSVSHSYDLFSSENKLIIGGAGNFFVHTGIEIELPPKTIGKIVIHPDQVKGDHLNACGGYVEKSGEIILTVSSSRVFDPENIHKYVGSFRRLEVFGRDGEDIQKIELEAECMEDLNNLRDYGNQLSNGYCNVLHPIVTPNAYLIREGEQIARLYIMKLA